MGQEYEDEDGKRYRIRIDGVSYYVFMSDVAVSVAYAYENREENIKTRTVLEKFCAELSKIMENNAHVRETLVNAATAGECSRIEGKVGTPKEVCG